MRTFRILLSVATLATSVVAQAQSYNWLNWTVPTSATAQATVPGSGNITLTTSGASTSTALYSLQFLNVPFTPSLAPAASASNFLTQIWSLTLDFGALATTQGLVIGIGNLGYGDSSLPGYAFTAKDAANATVAPSSFGQIGSYDHTWISPPTSAIFNDNLSLNSLTSKFNFVTVAGGDNFNSDILLLALPANVKTLTIQSDGAMGGDTVNVLAAAPVPEPHTLVLMLSGLAVIVARCRKVMKV